MATPSLETIKAIAHLNRSFSKGDTKELAGRLAEFLEFQSGGVKAVFDEGSFWSYCPEKGIYERIPQSKIVTTVGDFSDLSVVSGEKTSKLKLSMIQIEGAVKYAQSLLAEEKFFEKAPPGISFRNGFLTFIQNENLISVLAHDPKNRSRHYIDQEFDYNASCPRFASFIADVFPPVDDGKGGEIDDSLQRTQLLQEFIGACLFGLSTEYQTSLVLVGGGSNGKSVVTKVIQSLFPDDSVAAVPPQDWAKSFKLVDLVNKAVNIVSEMPAREVLSSEMFKGVVAGDTQTADVKYGASFKFIPKAGHIFACNRLPATRDQSDGYWRRFLVINFNRTITESERDIHLVEKLLSEKAGIIAWAVRGLERLRRQSGYTKPESSKIIKAEWQENADDILLFANECLISTDESLTTLAREGYSAGVKTASVKIYDHYKEWAARGGFEVINMKHFGLRMKNIFKSVRGNKGVSYLAVIRGADKNPQRID